MRMFMRSKARPANADFAPPSIVDYRLNTYMVISMPNRKSIAFGVSQVMMAPRYRRCPWPIQGSTLFAHPWGKPATGES